MAVFGIYVLGVMAVFVLTLIPCWINADDPGVPFFWNSIPSRVMMMLFGGTLMAASIAVTWPLSLPMMLIMWAKDRN